MFLDILRAGELWYFQCFAAAFGYDTMRVEVNIFFRNMYENILKVTSFYKFQYFYFDHSFGMGRNGKKDREAYLKPFEICSLTSICFPITL